MSESIWMVTSGEYSDYRVRVAFRDKALAEAHAAARSDHDRDYYGDTRVEELRLADVPPARVEVYKETWQFREDRKGLPTPWIRVEEVWDYDAPEGPYYWLFHRYGPQGILNVTGTDREAVKAVGLEIARAIVARMAENGGRAEIPPALLARQDGGLDE